MNLITMVDFVLEQRVELTPTARYERIYNYANFLKQPLKLEMFEGEDRLFNLIGNHFFIKNSNRFYIIDFDDDFTNRVIIEKDESKEELTVEWLCNHERLQLTGTAKKQIGL